MKRVFICPVNDGEAVEIRNLLVDHGEEIIVTHQPWGASWIRLEPEVMSKVEGLLESKPETIIFGIELSGSALWKGQNIDHHCYKDDDRSNPKSSLEQVAEMLGVQLNRYQTLIAINDKGWIPALEKFGASLDEIKIIRVQDRLAQGVTPDQEAQAVADIAVAEWNGRKVIVHCPKGSSSAITDRLYGQYDECLTVDELLNKWIYFGPRHKQFYSLTEGGTEYARWFGGGDTSGYSGVEKPSEELQKKILDFFRG